MNGLALVPKEDHTAVDLGFVVRTKFGNLTEINSGDPTHGDSVEIAKYGFGDGDLLAERVQCPVARPVELHSDSAHVGGDFRCIERFPEFLWAVVDQLSAKYFGLESSVASEDA